jgi:hypothetical protein
MKLMELVGAKMLHVPAAHHGMRLTQMKKSSVVFSRFEK